MMHCRTCKKTSRRKSSKKHGGRTKRRSHKAGGPSLINVARQIRRAGRISGVSKITNALAGAGVKKLISSM
jgi:hypothetical protein